MEKSDPQTHYQPYRDQGQTAIPCGKVKNITQILMVMHVKNNNKHLSGQSVPRLSGSEPSVICNMGNFWLITIFIGFSNSDSWSSSGRS